MFYLDDEDREKFISFSLCHLNYVMSFVENGQKYSREERQAEIQRRRTIKLIADTNTSGGYPFDSDLPCIEFYTNPPILFEFTAQEMFKNIQRLLWDYGWTWRDRS